MYRNRYCPSRTAMLSCCLVATLGLSACSDNDDDSSATDTTSTADSADTGAGTDGVATSTAGVEGDHMDTTFNDSASVQANSESAWTCSDTTRELTANGIPYQAVGTFPNAANPNTISEQTVSISYTLDPLVTEMAT